MNRIVIHTKTGKPYLVLAETEMKDPGTREWIKAVIYKPLYGDVNKLYTRELIDFTEKFEDAHGQFDF